MAGRAGYRVSECECTWCNTDIEDGADVACETCYVTNETELAEIKRELKEAKKRIETLEGELAASLKASEQ